MKCDSKGRMRAPRCDGARRKRVELPHVWSRTWSLHSHINIEIRSFPAPLSGLNASALRYPHVLVLRCVPCSYVASLCEVVSGRARAHQRMFRVTSLYLMEIRTRRHVASGLSKLSIMGFHAKHL